MPTRRQFELDRLRVTDAIPIANLDFDVFVRRIPEAKMQIRTAHAGMTVASVDLSDEHSPV